MVQILKQHLIQLMLLGLQPQQLPEQPPQQQPLLQILAPPIPLVLRVHLNLVVDGAILMIDVCQEAPQVLLQVHVQILALPIPLVLLVHSITQDLTINVDGVLVLVLVIKVLLVDRIKKLGYGFLLIVV
jgi:hypothetical protein